MQVVYWIDVFTRQRYRDILIDSLRYCQKEKGLEVFAYVVMSNHIHLIVRSSTENLKSNNWRFEKIYKQTNCKINKRRTRKSPRVDALDV